MNFEMVEMNFGNICGKGLLIAVGRSNILLEILIFIVRGVAKIRNFDEENLIVIVI